MNSIAMDRSGMCGSIRALVALSLAIGAVGTALFVAPTPCDFSEARAKTAEIQITTLRAALEAFRRDRRFYPATSQGLAALVSGGYLRKVPTDPWNEPYEYSMYDSHYVLRSFGADHRFGGSGEDTDIDQFVVIQDES